MEISANKISIPHFFIMLHQFRKQYKECLILRLSSSRVSLKEGDGGEGGHLPPPTLKAANILFIYQIEH